MTVIGSHVPWESRLNRKHATLPGLPSRNADDKVRHSH